MADGHIIRKMQRNSIIRMKNGTILNIYTRTDPDRCEIRPDNRLTHHGNLIAEYDISTYVRGSVDEDITSDCWL